MKTLTQKYLTPVGCFQKILLDEEKSLRLVITGRCNLACEFCVYKIRDFYSPEVHSPKFVEMNPTKKLKNLLEKMKKHLGYNIVHLTGGEPTIAQNIAKIAKLSKDIGFRVNLCSNLVFMKPLLHLLQKGLLNELTFSYLPLDSENQRVNFPIYERPDKTRIKNIMGNAEFIKTNFPDLIVKSNIIISPFSDINNLVKFVYWCWRKGIVPRVQRDRSSNRILGSTKKTLKLLETLEVNPKKVILRIPGAAEICEFKSSSGKIIYVKIFNKNFRPCEICKFCNKKDKCSKSLSNIRIYDTTNGPIMCFCTEHNEDFAHLNIEQFFKSDVFDEMKGYKKNKLLYFSKFCTNPNFQ